MDVFSKHSSSAQPKYDPVDSADEEEGLVVQSEKDLSPNWRKEPSTKFWKTLALCSLLLTILIGTEWIITQKVKCNCSTLPGFDSEFGPARSAISLKQVRFSGSVKFDQDGMGYRVTDGPERYTGKPSPEIDEAWKSMMGDRRYFWYTEEEAKASFGPDYRKFLIEYEKDGVPQEGYLGGVEVFHSLHCLDTLRRHLYPEYYTTTPMALRFKSYPGVHLDHCLDQLRQIIVCNADLTPVPVRWRPTANVSYIDTDVVHTCRNFDAIYDWVHTRDFHDLI